MTNKATKKVGGESKPKSGGEGVVKRRAKKGESYAYFLNKLLKDDESHQERTISARAMSVSNDATVYLVESLIQKCGLLVQRRVNELAKAGHPQIGDTLKPIDVETVFRVHFPGELGHQLCLAGAEAVEAYSGFNSASDIVDEALVAA